MKRKFVLTVLFLFLAGSICGQTEPLKLNRLVNEALEKNPKLKSLRQLAEARHHRVPAEGALPDPVVGFSLKNIGLTEFTVGEEMMSGIGISFSQAIPFPGKLSLKSRIASTRALQAEESLRAEELSVVRQVKELYSRLFYYSRSVEVLRREKDVLENTLRLVEVKYGVGQGIQSDVFKAQVEISAVEEMIFTMDQMVRMTEARINSLLDARPERQLGTPEEIPLYQLNEKIEFLYAEAGKNSPLLKEMELMVEEMSAEVEMAKKEFYPNFMIQAGKDFKGPFKDMYEVMVGIEIPLYKKRKQAKLLEASSSRLGSSKSEYSSMRNEVSFMLKESFLAAETSGNLIKLYKERIIPQASLAFESSLANYKVGRADFFSLLSDISSLFSYEREYFKNLSQLWASVAKIEELTSLELIPYKGEGDASRN